MSDGVVTRAFELARESNCKNVEDIRRELKREGFTRISEHFEGLSFKRQLRAAINERIKNT